MEQRCINLGSYNYLGFAEGAGGATHADVVAACRRYGLATCSARAELGTTPLHKELEETTARFLGVEVTERRSGPLCILKHSIRHQRIE